MKTPILLLILLPLITLVGCEKKPVVDKPKAEIKVECTTEGVSRYKALNSSQDTFTGGRDVMTLVFKEEKEGVWSLSKNDRTPELAGISNRRSESTSHYKNISIVVTESEIHFNSKKTVTPNQPNGESRDETQNISINRETGKISYESFGAIKMANSTPSESLRKDSGTCIALKQKF